VGLFLLKDSFKIKFCFAYCLSALANKIHNCGTLLQQNEDFGFSHVQYRMTCVFPGFFLKENVRNPVWICEDPISLILGTQFSLILGTR